MNKRVSVLIAGDNPDIVKELKSNLEALGYSASSAGYRDIRHLNLREYRPEVLVVDLTTCNLNALSTCEMLMDNGTIPHRTVMTALVSDQSMGQLPLDYEFSEVILYPFDISELGFRLRRALYMNRQDNGNDTINIGNLSITPSRYEIKVDEKPVTLSHKEYELLKHLINHRNQVFTRNELFGTIWGSKDLGESRTVDVHIRRLRMKIGDLDKQYIKTIRGVGYTFRFENN